MLHFDCMFVDNCVVHVMIAVHQERVIVEMCSQEHPTTDVLLGELMILMSPVFGYHGDTHLVVQ